MQMKFDKLTQLGLGDMVDYFWKKNWNHRTAELNVSGVTKLPIKNIVAPSATRKFGELVETPDIFPGRSEMLPGTSELGSSHMRLKFRKPQSYKHVASLLSNQSPIHHRLRKRKLVILSASTHADSLCSSLWYKTWIWTNKWSQLLHCPRNRYFNCHVWQCMSLKSTLYIYFTTCWFVHGFSDQIVRHDNSSVHMSESYRQCQCSRLQIKFIDV